MNETKSVKELTELVAFLGSATHGVVNALKDGKVSILEAITLGAGNFREALTAFDGINEIPAELADLDTEELDAVCQVWLDRMGWNVEARTGARDMFNESMLTIRQVLKLLRVAQNTIHPPKAVVVPEP